MPLVEEIKNEIKEAKKLRLSWPVKLWGILGSVLCCWLFDHFGRFDLALPALNCAGMLAFAVALKWKLRQSARFWITITIIAALHVLLILFVPWTTRWVPAIAIAAIDSVDLIAILAILTIVGKYGGEPQAVEKQRRFL